jgi:hypothetical protein
MIPLGATAGVHRTGFHNMCGHVHLAYTRLTRAYCRAQANRHLRHMRNEERSQPLADGSILEYIVHGEYASKETDTNSQNAFWGAPEPLVIWAQLHAAGSNLAVCLRTGPGLLGTVA